MQKFLAGFIVLAVFALGILLGYRLAWDRPLPPVPHFGPFGPIGPAVAPGREGHPPTPQQVAAFEKELQTLRPQAEAFQQGFTALENNFHTGFLAILTPEQRDRFSTRHDDEIDWVGEFNQLASERIGAPPAAPDLHRDPRHVLSHLLRIVMCRPTLHILTGRLALTPVQQGQLEKLLQARRDAFLALTRDHPLPFDQLYFIMRDLGLLPQRLPQPVGH